VVAYSLRFVFRKGWHCLVRAPIWSEDILSEFVPVPCTHLLRVTAYVGQAQSSSPRAKSSNGFSLRLTDTSRPTRLAPTESASNCVQNLAFYRPISGRKASKANCINRLYGAGDGNRTHVRSLGIREALRPLVFGNALRGQRQTEVIYTRGTTYRELSRSTHLNIGAVLNEAQYC